MKNSFESKAQCAEQILLWFQKYRKLSGALVNRLALNIHKRIKELTPVDTGQAQAGWLIEAEPGGSYLISNNIEYISCLENGSSHQAPHGMVRVVMAEAQLQVEQAASDTGRGD
jgi:hypothetical protein